VLSEAYLLFALIIITAAFVFARVSRALKFHGKMLVTCPETSKPAAVKVDLTRAAMTSLGGHVQPELGDCSRWPERSDCGQDCVVQVEKDPQGHRVWTIASKWFEGKKCVYCKKPIPPFLYSDHKPAVICAEKITTQWDQICTEKLPETLSTAYPVCWSCHVAETFIREHSDLVVIRPWKKCGPLGEYIPELRPADSADDRSAS
jgi:hypothetical protein